MSNLQINFDKPIKLYCDNKFVIEITKNLVQYDHTKYIEIDRHFTKEKINNRTIITLYVSTQKQRADIFTKGLHSPRLIKMITKLRMENIHLPT